MGDPKITGRRTQLGIQYFRRARIERGGGGEGGGCDKDDVRSRGGEEVRMSANQGEDVGIMRGDRDDVGTRGGGGGGGGIDKEVETGKSTSNELIDRSGSRGWAVNSQYVVTSDCPILAQLLGCLLLLVLHSPGLFWLLSSPWSSQEDRKEEDEGGGGGGGGEFADLGEGTGSIVVGDMAESAGMMLGLSFGLGVVVGLGLGLRLAPASGSGYQAWLLLQQQKLLEKEASGADGMAGRNGYHLQKQDQQGGLCPRCSVSSITSASVEGSFDGSAAAYQSFSDRSVDALLLDDPPEFDLRAERRRWSINPLFVQAPMAAPGAAPEGGGGGAGGGDVDCRERPSDCRTAEEGDDNLQKERSHRQQQQQQQQRLAGDIERERGFEAATAAAPPPSQESPTVILRRLNMIIKQVETTLQRADMELEALKKSLPRRLCPPLRGFSPELLASIRAAFLPKLLIVDINGFLVHRCFKKEYNSRLSCGSRVKFFRPPDGAVGQFYIWERAHSRDFIRWAQANFAVGIWSSALQRNVHGLLEHLLGENAEESFTFVWDQSLCTGSGLRHPENRHKAIYFKELSKVWACEELITLYNETNTLLVDECAYKVIKNPPYTSIHPPEYVGNDKGDNALGEGGLIREELKRFQGASSVQSFARASPLALTAGKLTDLSAQLARAQIALLEEQCNSSRTTSEGTITPESSQEGSCVTSTNGSSRSTSKPGTPRHQLKRRSSLDGSLPPFRAGGVLRRLSLKETNIPTRSVTQPRSPGSKARAPAKLKDAGSPFV
ncbi:hypothetical protein CBR_g54065 [Chara braunii]|uniref:FCP1 homology domain-containing protein n=1 Tax=Chara braunii TaxID=69332 RepID=A0A388MBY6_CHABU|nr:hypothetical protein CBR_g54065 [Chara braunii]|eukprot:GBG91969.1 hypothetical protein CBR_g54065 [Chara braunii]